MANEFAPEPDPYLLVQSYITLYDQDEDALADPIGYGDPEDDVGSRIRRTCRIHRSIRCVEVLDYLRYVDAIRRHIRRTRPRYSSCGCQFGLRPVAGVPLWVTAGVQKFPYRGAICPLLICLATRAFSSVWMVPNRDTGVVARYKIGQNNSKVLLYAGVFNGNESLFGDDNVGKSLVGRVDFTSGTAATLKTYGVVDGVTVGLGGDVQYNQGIATDETILGGDLIVRAQGLHCWQKCVQRR